MAVGEYATPHNSTTGTGVTASSSSERVNSEAKPEAGMAPRKGNAVYIKDTLPSNSPPFPSKTSARSLFLFVSNQLFSLPPSFFNSLLLPVPISITNEYSSYSSLYSLLSHLTFSTKTKCLTDITE